MNELTVQIDSGRVRGAGTGSTMAWRGIPYAAPPVDELRFRAPQPVGRWAGVRDATAFGPAPMQRTSPLGRRSFSEDCLTINVERPRSRRPGLRPVMVWIYGGAFVMGGSDTVDAAALASAGDVVVVSFNYRVGAFGFTDFRTHGTAERPFDSNNGLRDQVAALQWVQRNIAHFGGDPDNVTLFGESAGAISVLALMTAPSARGLFHRAIAESPAPGVTFGPQRHARWADQFLSALATPGGTTVERLRRATGQEIVAATDTVIHEAPRAEPGTLNTSPVVDGDVLPESPYEAFGAGRAAPIPLVIGTNADEGRLFQMLARFTADKLLPTDRPSLERLFAQGGPGHRERVLAAYRGFPSAATIARIAGDFSFWVPSLRVAEGHSRVAPTWSYRFDHVSPLMRLSGQGATHAAEVAYVFGHAGRGPGPLARLGGGRAARDLSDRMVSLWTDFARDGELPPSWPRYDEGARSTKVFNTTDRVDDDPGRGIRLAWRDFPGWQPGA